VTYRYVCHILFWKVSDKEDAFKVAEGIRAVIASGIDEFLYDYPCQSKPWSKS